MLRLGLMLLYIFYEGARGQTTDELSMQAAYMDEILQIQQNHSISETLGEIESKVIFYLYTRNSQHAPEVLDPRNVSTLDNSKFKLDIPTKFLIHGYLGDVNNEMIQSIKDRFVETQDVNVIAVDWGKIAVHVDYFAVARRTRSVGRYVTEMLDLLVSRGCKLQDFHLIGHSLGAHIAGFAGKMARYGKPGRITGLDPARPAFSSAGPSERLDANDGQLVDCIHTCGGLLGIDEPICGADFYANGGKHAQPGCLNADFGKCSHTRSHEYFAESILPGHFFPSLECPALAEDLVDCVESSYFMGNYLKSSARGLFYVLTNSKYPYAPINGA